jgi:predicted nuclease of restriction endonuclease-like (RecB) superfamily
MTYKSLDFEKLVGAIHQVHAELAAQANRAVNVSLTLRNWMIGCYITEYEQNGADRAKYGDRLLDRLSASLSSKRVTRTEERELRRYRQFYQIYPQIWEAVSPELQQRLLGPLRTKKFEKRETPTPELAFPAKELIAILSFSHFVELLKFEDPVQRAFYEIDCRKGNWSVRELKRQIGSLYYERSSLSRNKKRLSEMARQDTHAGNLNITVRDPYVFEFLGLKSEEVMSESHLEDQLLDKLQEFLLELGHGFCFEARQKRILIGDEHFFVDLVFYHRILKCHVLVELKLETFNHQNIGQLNTYVSWYRKNMMAEDDNPPVGILLCTGKNQTLVEYALAGMDNQLFVSKYMLELPKKEDIQRFIEQQIQESKKE